MITKDTLQIFLTKDKTSLSPTYLKSRMTNEIYNFIDSNTPSILSLPEKIYRIINACADTACYCNAPLKFLSFKKGYSKFCSIKCSANDTNTIAKREQTCIDRYGTTSPLQNITIKNKVKATCIEKYGVDNVRKTEEVKAKIRGDRLNSWLQKRLDGFSDRFVPLFTINEYKTSKNTYQFLCKICNTEITSNFADGTIPSCKKCSSTQSSGHREIVEFLKSCRIENIEINNRNTISPLELDIYIPSLKIAIEYNGLYFHSEKFVKSSYHKDKLDRCESLGIRLITIFEDEWLLKRSIVKSRLRNFFSKNTILYARKANIKKLSIDESRSFFDINHIQGFTPAKYTYGLEIDGIIVCSMSFGKSRYNKKADIELIRFANLINHSVVGGASRLLNHFIKTHNPLNIISYADRCWSSGDLYEHLGFSMTHITDPGFTYLVNKNRVSRFKYQKHKLKDILKDYNPSKSARDNMVSHGYLRVFDCGHRVYFKSL